ncbi:MAG: TlpA disulfide reductase family protein [Gemmatimonadaceae bacterium]
MTLTPVSNLKLRHLFAATLFAVSAPFALDAQTGADTAPAFSLQHGPIFASMRTLAGDSLTIGRGAPATLVAVFATWCRPCQDEVPIINMLQRDFSSKVRVVALDEDEGNTAHVRQWLKQHGATYPVVQDTYGVVSKSLHAPGVPALYLVNSSGHAEWARTGAMLALLPELRARLKQLPDLPK